MKPILVFGLGNPYRCDDAAGIIAAERLKDLLPSESADVRCGSVDGLTLISECSGYKTVIILDSIRTGSEPAGTLVELEPENFMEGRYRGSSHGIDFIDALNMGRELSLPLPEKIRIFAVEIEDNTSYTEQCTPNVEKGIEKMVEAVIMSI